MKKCPPDCNKNHFEEVFSVIPKGMRLVRSRVLQGWRDFYFVYAGGNEELEKRGFKPGDEFVTSVVLK